MSGCKQNCEGLILRIVWIALFVLVWQVAELVLLAVVVVQLAYRIFTGRPNVDAMNFGDSLSQYLAQIGRFGSFHSDEKPWPFTDWPTPREPQGEGAEAVRAAAVATAPVQPAAPASPSPSPSPEPQAASGAPVAESVPAQAEPEAKGESVPATEAAPAVAVAEPAAAGEAKPDAAADTPAEPKA
jgi:hypothetical protein